MRNPFQFLLICSRRLIRFGLPTIKHKTFHTSQRNRFLTSAYFENNNNCDGDSVNDEECEGLLSKDNPFYKNVDNFYTVTGAGHQVLMVQPRIRTQEKVASQEEAALMLDESVALIETLPNWKVVKQCIVNAVGQKSSMVFGKGNLEKLKQVLHMNPQITAIVIGVDMLMAVQNANLEEHFSLPIFDRYQIVLKIFYNHARTKEARLQTALAEIPYLRVKLTGFSHNFKPFEHIGHVGGSGETHTEMRARLLFEREVKLKRALEKIRTNREFLRRGTKRSELPRIAVIGYTNCGKTTLIKALTKDAKLVPVNKLFATLDVTLHSGILPSSQKVLYIDTVGFISNIPTSLIQCFRSTLEDMIEADIIIHVRDVSHPDTEMQKQVVLKTLTDLQLPEKLLTTIVEVGNKVDLVKNAEELKDEEMVLISAKKGDNLGALMESIETQILLNMDYQVVLFRVHNGGTEYRWLLKESTIRDSIADPKDYNYLIVESVISKGNFGKFTKNFGDLTITPDQIEIS